MKQHILMVGPLPRPQMEQLKARYELHLLWKSDDPEAMVHEVRDKVTAIVATAWNAVSGRLIRALPNLEIIANFGVGYDNIDVEAARERGIPVTNTPDVLTEDTADLAVTLMMAVLRRVVEGDMYVRAGRWAQKGMMPLGRSPRGRRIGILGLGRIGRAIAKRAEVFGMEVLYHGPRRKDGVDYEYVETPVALAAACDVLMVSCPGGEETRHLVNGTVLNALGADGIVVNIARGSVIDESALIDALQSGAVGGAGLDVFEDEPHVPTEFMGMDNVVLQPHVGSATVETREAMGQLVVDNLGAYFDKAELITPIVA